MGVGGEGGNNKIIEIACLSLLVSHEKTLLYPSKPNS
jgi:hypothetical protein